MNLPLHSETERHCYKCNEYKEITGGTMHRDGRGRRRFVCAQCLTFIPGRHKLLGTSPRAAAAA